MTPPPQAKETCESLGPVQIQRKQKQVYTVKVNKNVYLIL